MVPKILCCSIFAGLLICATDARAQPNDDDANWHISLHSREIQPEPGMDAAVRAQLTSPSQRIHVYVQLYEPLKRAAGLERSTRERLAEEYQLILQSAVQGTASPVYRAEIDTSVLAIFDEDDNPVRWIGAVEPEDKIRPSLRQALQPRSSSTFARNNDGTLALIVTFYDAIGLDEAGRILQGLAESYRPTGADGRGGTQARYWLVNVRRERVRDVAAQDAVEAIEAATPFIPLNERARAWTDVDIIQNAVINSSGPPTYYGLTGKGVSAGILDTPVDKDHLDFLGRLTVIGTPDSDQHGTHVAGTVGASGVRSDAADGDPYQWRGMAPDVHLVSIDVGSNYEAWDSYLYYQVIVEGSAAVSNHSYVQSCSGYNAVAANIDAIVRGDAGLYPVPARPAIWAVGNAGAVYDAQCVVDWMMPHAFALSGYFGVLAPAKNPIVVGGLQKKKRHELSSSLGPTLDGRIKPEVVAPYCVTSTEAESNDYIELCGTSSSAPTATGIVALLLERWHQVFGPGKSCVGSAMGDGACFPLPSTIKAIMVESATDLVYDAPVKIDPVSNEFVDPEGHLELPSETGKPVRYGRGPDYATGFGMLNAKAAIEIVSAGPGPKRRVVESELFTAGDSHSYTLNVPSNVQRISVTLAWDDPPGDPNSSYTASKLVNDLDLTLVDPDSGTHLPWVLEASDAFAPAYPDSDMDGFQSSDVPQAAPGIDHRNNVEKVEVFPQSGASSLPPGEWTINVAAHDIKDIYTQKYSLAWTVEEGASAQTAQFSNRSCSEGDWTPIPGGIRLQFQPLCTYAELEPICHYVLNCPGCNSAGFCPAYEAEFSGLPDSVRIEYSREDGTVVPQEGELPNPRNLWLSPDAGVRYRLLFIDDSAGSNDESFDVLMRLSDSEPPAGANGR